MDLSAAGKTFPPYEFRVERGKIKVGARTVSFQGAVWQPLNQGYGMFILDNVPGVAGFVTD